MPHKLRAALAAMLAAALPLQAQAEPADTAAQNDRWTLQAGANYGYMIHSGEYHKELLHSYATGNYDVRLKWQKAQGSTDAPYDKAMNWPTLQVGVLHSDYSHIDLYRTPETRGQSRLGSMWTLFGGMQVDALRNGRWSVAFDVEHGAGFCTDPFSETTNTENEIIGSRLSIFMGLGATASYRLTPQLSLSAGLHFLHYSNGSLARPNLGANTVGPSVALSYDLQPTTAGLHNAPATDAGKTAAPHRRPRLYVEIMAGMGLKALADGFNQDHSSHQALYAFPTAMVAPMCRWHLLHATGIGLDYTYAHYAYRLRQFDQKNQHTEFSHSPHIAGVSLRHEVFYRSFSLNVGLGVYLKKETGFYASQTESRTYQHVALRYQLPLADRRLFVGYNIKAHRFQKVDCVQLVAGCRLGGSSL